MGKKKQELNDYDEPFLTCPDCGSGEVTVEHHEMFMANSGDHYCHSTKSHDQDSPSMCLDCGWKGERHQLKHEALK